MSVLGFTFDSPLVFLVNHLEQSFFPPFFSFFPSSLPLSLLASRSLSSLTHPSSLFLSPLSPSLPPLPSFFLLFSLSPSPSIPPSCLLFSPLFLFPLLLPPPLPPTSLRMLLSRHFPCFCHLLFSYGEGGVSPGWWEDGPDGFCAQHFSLMVY